MPFLGEENRRAARIRFRLTDNLEARYKCLSHLDEFQCDTVFAGAVLNLSKGGALLVGEVPGREWLPRLGQGLVLIGLNLMIPSGRPVKALASLRWTRPAPEGVALPERLGRGPHYELGLQFEQIDPAQLTALEKFLIGHQLRTRRFSLRDELKRGGM